MPGRDAGFTLLEMLVVVMMVGILATTVTLSFAPDTHRQLQDEAWRFAQVLEAASEQAERGDPLALSWQADGYRFWRQSGDGRWLSPDDALLGERRWPSGIRAEPLPDERSPLAGNGDIVPRVLLLRTDERELAVTLSPLGRATVEESR